MKRMIIVAVVFLALIPTLLTGVAVYYYAYTTVKTEKLDALAGTVDMMDNHISNFYSRLATQIKLKTEKDELRHMLVDDEDLSDSYSIDRSKAEAILNEPIGYQVKGGSIINLDGKVVLSSHHPNEEGLMLNQTELYQSIMDGRGSYNGIVKIPGVTDELEVAVPILEGNKIIGILKQDMDIDLLSSYLKSLNIDKSGHAFLILNNGYLYFGDGKKTPAVLYHEYQNNNSLEQLVSDFKTGRLLKDRGTVTYENKGIAYVGTYNNIESVGCVAVIALNYDGMYGELRNLKAILAASIVIAVTMVAALGYIIVNLHTNPLKIMNDALNRIANGDMTARCRIDGNRAFEELCRNINNLADNYQKNERELRISSRIDSLTRLPNRNAIYEVLDTLLYKHPKQAVLLLDLDGFKDVNDNLGFDIGDRILMEVGDILRKLPQHICYPSRLGGAEFLVFVTNWTAPKYPEKIAQKIINEIEGIRFIDEVHVDVSASIGIEYTDDDKIDKRKMIKHSNIAMHKAKNIGKNSYFVYYPYMQKDR